VLLLGVMRLWNRVGGIEVHEGIRHVARMHAPNCWRHCRPRNLYLTAPVDVEGTTRIEAVRW
jgi:hypothetical protein